MDLDGLDDLKKILKDYLKQHKSETAEALKKEVEERIESAVRESIL